MFKRLMLAVALMASAMIGVTAVSAVSPAVAGAQCGQPSSIDFGWFNGKDQVFHAAADFYVNQSTCGYVTHYNVDCYGYAGWTVYGCAGGWLDEWNVITHVSNGAQNSYYGLITLGPPNVYDAGVALVQPNTNYAWCKLNWATPQHQSTICTSAYSGSENHSGVVHWAQWGPVNGQGSTVDLRF